MTEQNYFKDIPQPEIINITKESHPDTWAILEGKDNTEDKGKGKKQD
jgi:hypothetical protein